MVLIIAKLKNNQDKKFMWGVFEKKSIFDPTTWLLARYIIYEKFETKKEAEQYLKKFKKRLARKEWIEDE